MFTNVENPDRCPVSVYKEYASRRPVECLSPESDYYLAINYNKRPTDFVWYKRAPLGINMLKTMMVCMCKGTGIQGHKTNHSVRRTILNQLLDHGVPGHAAKELSGHKNVASLSAYAEPGLNQQHGMASILMGESSVRTLPAIQPVVKFPAPSKSLPSTSPSAICDTPSSTDNMAVTAVTAPRVDGQLSNISNSQENRLYGIFAGATIHGGHFTFSFPK